MMAPLSDRTLAEQLARRLRAAGVYQMLVRSLGAGEVFISALGFDPAGRTRRVSGTASTLADALLQLLAELAADDERTPHEGYDP
jgi:hypothetical protein